MNKFLFSIANLLGFRIIRYGLGGSGRVRHTKQELETTSSLFLD